MRRRRRPQREIAFSFDSFLDVVANVVGVIIRLILVAWVGARTYKAVLPPAPEPPPALTAPEPLPEPSDPREGQLVRRRQEIEQRASELGPKTAQQRQTSTVAAQLRRDLEVLLARRKELSGTKEEQAEAARRARESALAASMSIDELQARSQKLMKDLEGLRRLPPPRKELRYMTPVSSPVQSEELMFECQRGRVALIDTGAMLAEIRREARSRGEQLKNAWQRTEMTAPVGAFRLRYILERERGLLDGPASGTPVDGPFRFGVTSWEVVPIQVDRGETAEQALQSNSAFRNVVDRLDPQVTAVTFWVYPDSFPLYRQLRDYLHRKDVMVAGRPLPEGLPIASSRHGTVSRGQ
ncbi:MAG: hypothetical protein U0840_17150 [Gemmataceae bacterium]